LLLAAAFLLREATTFLSLGMLPLMAVAIGLVRNDRMSAGPTGASAFARRLAAGALLLLPLAATHAEYSSWNKQRTGTAFITTGGQTAMLLPLVEAAARDPQIFSGDAPLDKAANHSLSRYGYDEVLAINGQLFADWHMTAPEISAAVYGKYVSSWREHPGTMARVFLAHLRENQLFLLFRPVDSLREYILWATGRQTDLGRWKSVAADIRFLPLFVADAVCKTISVALFLAFLLVTPWRALREREGFALQRVCLCLWMLYLAWFSTYALVHLDTRYMAPVLPFAILIGTANLSWVLSRTWREIGRKPVETERAR
jgi:hypothetical protein